MIPTVRTRQQVPVGGRPSRMARPVLVGDAVPTEGSVGAVTDSNLPRPGASGLAWVREVHDVPRAGHMVDAGSRVNPFRPVIEGSMRAGGPHIPISEYNPLAEPTAATTADALVRFKENPHDRHARLYRRLPDIGGFAPWQGLRFRTARKGPTGGIPSLPAGLLHDLPLPDPKTVPSQGTVLRGLRAQIGAARRGLKPVVRLTPGLGGLDVAQSPRLVPDTPSGVREAIRDIRPKQLRGAFIGHRTVPGTIVETLAAERSAQGPPPPPPSQEGTTYLAQTPAAPDLKHSAPVPTEPVGLVASVETPEGEPTGLNFGFVALVAIAALVLFRA